MPDFITQGEIDKANAQLVFAPKFIPYYPALASKGLTDKAMLLYGFIEFYLSTPMATRFYFTNEQLGQIVNAGVDTVSKAIKSLEEAGLIRTHRAIKQGGGQIRFVELVNQVQEEQMPTNENHKSDLWNSLGNNNNINNNNIYMSTFGKKANADTQNLPYSYKQFVDKINAVGQRRFTYLNKKAQMQLNARLKEGWTPEQIETAIENAHKDPYHVSTNYQYLLPEFFTRADKLERHTQVPANVNVEKQAYKKWTPYQKS